MPKPNFLLSLIVCWLLFLSPVSTVAAEPNLAPNAWTIMVYLDGDNNLEHCALLDFLEMEQALPAGVEVIVLFDRHQGYSQALGNVTGTHLYRVRKARPFDLKKAAMGLDVPLPGNLSSELLEDWGEVDMADPATLTRFIKTCAKLFQLSAMPSSLGITAQACPLTAC